MIHYAVRALGAHFRAGRALYLLTIAGVALGVAAVLTVQVVNRSAVAAFGETVRVLSGDADLTVLGVEPSFDERLLARALGVSGVAAASPVFRHEVAVDSLILDIVALDLAAPSPGTRRPVDGLVSASSAIETPGWIAVHRTLAARRSWALGDSLVVHSGRSTVVLRIGALLALDRVAPLASSRLAVMDIAEAQSRFGGRGSIHQIDIRTRPGADLDAVAADLRRGLGDGVEVTTPAARTEQAGALLAAFRTNLTALSLVSVLVGLFLVHATTRSALVRRRREFGLLRSVGATRGQIAFAIGVEVTVLAVLGIGAGLPLGLWAARANVDIASATLTNLYLLESIERAVAPPWMFWLGAAVGVTGVMLGAAGPATDMARRHPIDLLASFAVHRHAAGSSPRLATWGLALLGGSGIWYALGGRHWVHAGFALAAALLVAIPCLVPVLLGALGRLVRAQRFGWRYGGSALAARAHTTAFAVAALSVAITMLVGITIMVGSFRVTFGTWLDRTVQADAYVTTPTGTRNETGFDDAFVEALRATPSVRAVDRLRAFDGFVNDRSARMLGVDFPLGVETDRFPLRAGEAAAAQAAVRAGDVLISEPLSRKLRVAVGDTLTLGTGAGDAPVRVAGVYYDYSTERGAVAMSLPTMTRLFGPGPVHNLAVYADPDAGEELLDRLRERFAGDPARFRSNRSIREGALGIFEQTFAITRVLQTMGLVIAIVGITQALLIFARERTAELALYRALGATRRQLFSVFLGQGGALGGMSVATGLAAGAALAGILIFITNPAYFGWTIRVHVPWAELAGQVAAILAATVAAAVYPALRASAVPATELRHDDA